MYNLTTILLLLLLQCLLVLSAPAPEPVVQTQYLYIKTSIYTPRAWSYKERTETWPETTERITYTITPTASPSIALSTVTDTSTPEVTLVQILLPSDATATRVGQSETRYAIPVTLHPLSSCLSYNQNWTSSTDLQFMIPLTMPSSLRNHITQVTPLSMTPSTTTWYSGAFARATIQIAVLNPTDLPSSIVASVSATNYPTNMNFCQLPTTTCSTYYDEVKAPTTTVWTQTSVTCYAAWTSDASWTRDHGNVERYTALFVYVICVSVIPGVWFIFFFLLGIWESYRQMGKLMRGEEVRMGLPISWGFLFFCCWFGVGPRWKARSKEDQELLRMRWNALKLGERWKLWWKWGTVRKYPVALLGPAPEKRKGRCC